MQRQQRLLTGDPQVHLSLVLCESVLLRAVGGTAVFAAQREHLLAMNRREHIDVRVLTFESGAHPALNGHFTVFDLDSEADPDVAYIESMQGAHYLEKPSELSRYRGTFAALWSRSTALEEFL